jgi:phosphoribosylformylglycinamidine cyclo-ligase
VSAPLDYRSAGVDLEKADDAKGRIKALVESTLTAGARGSFGGFGGMFRVPAGYRAPVLVSSADGVGTKVKVAIEAGVHDTVGRDLVNHCVNDILVMGAVPLYFLDYVAFGKLDPVVAEAIVAGVAHGCRENSCALLGGETAEMPGVYHDGHVDVVGTLVGVADRERLLPRDDVAPGDVLLALGSSGPHTNGYSLLRKVFAGFPLDAIPPGMEVPLGDALLAIHRNYLTVLSAVLDTDLVKALAHITGGGLPGNLPRSLPADCGATVRIGSWPVPPLFQVVRDASGLDAYELHRTLNMGVGMVLIVAPGDLSAVQALIDEPTWVIGEVTRGEHRVSLI